MSNYVAAGAFVFRKMAPHVSGSLERPPTLPQALFLFLSRKNTPIFLEALNGPAPIFLEALEGPYGFFLFFSSEK